MTNPASPFFATNRTEPIHTSKFDVKLMKALFAELESTSSAAGRLESSTLKRQSGQTAKEFRDLKDYLEGLCRLKVFLTTNDGDQFSSTDSSIFEDARIPSTIKIIVFDSSPEYFLQLNRRPMNWMRVELDLTTPVLLDFTISPSAPTVNQSNFAITAQDAGWARLTHSGLQRVLAEAKTHLSFLHARNTYDFLYIAVGFPISFLLLLRIHTLIVPVASQLPNNFFYYLVLTFVLVLLANLFRLVFNYTRWVFPYVQLDWGRTRLAQIIWLAVFAPVSVLSVQQAWTALAHFIFSN